jgi:glyoxylase-like metal-dependent hydrolase (beta-lactamase superfamily II)
MCPTDLLFKYEELGYIVMFNFRARMISALAVATATTGFAQYQQAGAQAKGADKSALRGELVKTGLYFISGAGGNTLLRLSANGLILVDGKLPGNYQALILFLKKISDQPIRVLINTDYHEDHTGNNASFLESGAEILAQENVRDKLNASSPPGAKAGLPTKTYDRDFSFHLGGIEVQVMHFANAHTNGDSVVYFSDLKVIAVGDLYAVTPDPDYAAGGSLAGWGPALTEILKLDFDVAVPGTGPTVTRADLQTFKRKIETMVARGKSLVKSGVPRDRIMAELLTSDLGFQMNFTPSQLERFYAELSDTK